jgi:small subunit ribosomal protein S3
MAEQIVTVLERFGPKRFKSVGYKTLQKIIDAGAMGAEIVIGGRGLPGARAKTWRFYAGYLKKSGDISMSKVAYGEAKANLNSGTVGIKVKILPPNTALPDKIKIKDLSKQVVAEVKVEEVKIEEKKEEKKEVKKKAVKKKTAKKPKEEKIKDEKKEDENKE